MIFGLGVVFHLRYTDKKGRQVLADMGFTKRKMALSLILDLVFADRTGDSLYEGRNARKCFEYFKLFQRRRRTY